MTDLNQTIIKKAQGNLKLKPDEQRKYLETFAERVIASVALEEIGNPLLKAHFREILTRIQTQYQPIWLKISPQVDSSLQIFYMKIARDLGSDVTIVSSNCQHSPFGLIIHTDQPVVSENKDLFTQYPDLLQDKTPEKKTQKQSFWKKLFQ
ncbi:DUF1694 domain-containing protein [Streptococcus oricebi]|uniref:DUF1694 domain-containing protein n=1 Tax=Streptococcus oricebi TaxID=1547447 RepID=A0ABS5B113_9STRE|nr:DUF1694 domain-containing protein [Streptococcus oricebi]MBP2622514.1 DUF1694 domain-containing protein [Streptococcus oricebi]